MCLFWHSPTEVTHERTALPSIRTVQAPQRPSPQPYLLPVRSRSSRKTPSRLRDGSVSVRCLVPLTCSSVTLAIGAPLGPAVDVAGHSLGKLRGPPWSSPA